MRRVSNDFAICIRHSVWRTQSAMSFSHSTFRNPKSEMFFPHSAIRNPKSEIKSLFFLSVVFLFLTFHFLLSPSNLFAQTPEWVYQYVNPAGTDVPSAIIADSSGNTYTTGHLTSQDTTGGHIEGVCVIKLDSSGELKWCYFNDSLGRLTAGYDIAMKNNRVYVTGYTGPSPSNSPVFISLCVDTNGQRQWVFMDTIAIRGNAIAVSSSYGVYACGLTSGYDMICIKLDTLGNEVWRYVYDGPAGSYDEASSIVIDRNENIYIGGYSTGGGTSTDFTIIKLDSAGQEQWVYRYDGPASYNDAGGVIGFDRTGNIYCLGYSWGIGLDFCVIKLSPSGQEEWVYRFNGPVGGDDFPGCGVVDDSGNIYVTGVSADTGSILLFTVMKLDSAGQQRWCYLSRGPDGRGGSGGPVVLDGLGNIYVGGRFLNTAGRS
ncbi:MAG: SBBP repeat-containing protein, partial [candidate division WOR-3 bacterium]